MGDILKNKKTFCLAPFVHSYISPQGERMLCCVANHTFGKNVTLEEMWNGNEMKRIRQKMILNETLDECARCNDTSINPTPYKAYWNKSYEWLILDVLLNTKDDGTYLNNPIAFDYRSSICNFKCKMCTEEYSSQIQGEKLKNGLELSFNILNSEEREKSLEIISKELDDIQILKNIRELYWAGGEPLYWKQHWETLEKLIENDFAKNVKLRYSSNLSTIEYKGKLLTEYFKEFKYVEFYCSLDGTGIIGEWIRTNLNYKKWKENFAKLVEFRNNNENCKLKLAIAVTTPTLFDIENLYELCKEFDVEPDLQSCYAENASNLLSPKTFPREAIEQIIFKFLGNTANDDNDFIKVFREYFKFLLNETFFESTPEYLSSLDYAIGNLEYLEKNRPHSKINFYQIISQNKKMKEFFDKLKKYVDYKNEDHRLL